LVAQDGQGCFTVNGATQNICPQHKPFFRVESGNRATIAIEPAQQTIVT
jgi:hypothetical protein